MVYPHFLRTAVLSSAVCLMAMAAAIPVEAKVQTTKTTGYTVALASYLKNKPSAQDLEHPTTKCLTPSMIALRSKSLKQMEADIRARGDGHEDAVEVYREKMATIGEALELPYCGYGSGLAAIRHSFNKSVERARAGFLSATK